MRWWLPAVNPQRFLDCWLAALVKGVGTSCSAHIPGNVSQLVVVEPKPEIVRLRSQRPVLWHVRYLRNATDQISRSPPTATCRIGISPVSLRISFPFLHNPMCRLTPASQRETTQRSTKACSRKRTQEETTGVAKRRSHGMGYCSRVSLEEEGNFQFFAFWPFNGQEPLGRNYREPVQTLRAAEQSFLMPYSTSSLPESENTIDRFRLGLGGWPPPCSAIIAPSLRTYVGSKKDFFSRSSREIGGSKF